ncbi:MAG: cobalamin biosynthesis protein CobQ, partial [Xenococcus sp. (in: cyanobacteria)]
MELSIGWLYPKLMSTYGDRGNVICVQRRCQWRDIGVSILPLDREADSEQFNKVDIIVGGGAQDRQQEIVMRDLQGAKA